MLFFLATNFELDLKKKQKPNCKSSTWTNFLDLLKKANKNQNAN